MVCSRSIRLPWHWEQASQRSNCSTRLSTSRSSSKKRKGSTLKTAKSVDEAVKIFVEQVERPLNPEADIAIRREIAAKLTARRNAGSGRGLRRRLLPERHHQHVAIGGLRRGSPARPASRRGSTRASSTSAASSGSVSVKLPSVRSSRSCDRRGAAVDVAAVDQQHQHVVDAVAMHALGRRLALLAAARLDAELVDLDVPARRRRAPGGRTARGSSRGWCACVAPSPISSVDRLEPALDAAVQRVVVEASGSAAGAAPRRIGPCLPAP